MLFRSVLRYAEPCNGSVGDIAAVCNERGNVMGLMPHPERATEPLMGSSDGLIVFESMLQAVQSPAVNR